MSTQSPQPTNPEADMDRREYRITLKKAEGAPRSDEDPRVRFVRKQLEVLLQSVVLKHGPQEVKVDGFELVTAPGQTHRLFPERIAEVLQRVDALENITLFLTTRCNCACPHCPEIRTSKPVDLDWQLARTVVASAAKAGIPAISFTGGEPCLYPSFTELVAEVVAAGLKLTIVSNGRDFERYEQVMQAHPSLSCFIRFSVDGSCAEVNDPLRGAGMFDRVKKSVEACAKRFKPGINITLQKANLDDLEKALDEFAGWPISTLALGVVLADQDPEGSALTRDQRESVLKRLYEWRDQRGGFPWGVTLHPNIFRPRDDQGNLKIPANPPCPDYAFVSPAVRVDGGVFFCCDVRASCPPVARLAVGPGGELQPSLAEIERLGRRYSAELHAQRAQAVQAEPTADTDRCELCGDWLTRAFAG